MKRHPFDIISFAAGIAFLLLAAMVALGSDPDFGFDAWLIPVAFLVLGIGILAASVRGLRRTNGGETKRSD